MIAAIHQPNFLPWAGFFHKMARADRFVFLDSVPFTKGGYTNRVRIKTASGPQWLTVPVLSKGKSGQPIREVQYDPVVDWRSKVVRTLQANYGRCPHYSLYAGPIEQILRTGGDSLADLNIRLIEYVADLLDMRTPTTRSSQMNSQGKAADLLIALCQELGADTYLSGSGAADYQDEQTFQKAGVRLTYTGFVHPTYPQAFGDFQAGLSIVDLLFHCGPQSAALVRG